MRKQDKIRLYQQSTIALSGALSAMLKYRDFYDHDENDPEDVEKLEDTDDIIDDIVFFLKDSARKLNNNICEDAESDEEEPYEDED